MSSWRKIKRLRNEAFTRQNGKCYWCGTTMLQKPSMLCDRTNKPFPWNLPYVCTADHLIMVAGGGKTDASNIVAACRKCNNARDWSWAPGEPKPEWRADEVACGQDE